MIGPPVTNSFCVRKESRTESQLLHFHNGFRERIEADIKCHLGLFGVVVCECVYDCALSCDNKPLLPLIFQPIGE